MRMTQPSWLTKWQAREAIKNGQPEEAHRLLNQLIASGDRRAWPLRQDLVKGYVQRAEKFLDQDNIEGAWKDLILVEGLAQDNSQVVKLRETLTRLGIAESRAYLENARPLQAIEAVMRLKNRPATHPDCSILEEISKEWIGALDQADRGEFETVKQQLQHIRSRLRGRTAGLDRVEEKIEDRHMRYQHARKELTQALVQQDWAKVLEQAEEILIVAPKNREAQETRTIAWQKIQALPTLKQQNEPVLIVDTFKEASSESDRQGKVKVASFEDLGSPSTDIQQAWSAESCNLEHGSNSGFTNNLEDARIAYSLENAPKSSVVRQELEFVNVSSSDQASDQRKRPELAETKASTSSKTALDLSVAYELPKRFILWIDGYDAFLVCLHKRITLGQAIADNSLDIPVFADISRVQANFLNEDEAIVMESSSPLRINQKQQETAILRDRDFVELTPNCSFQFLQKVPGCRSAILDFSGSDRLVYGISQAIIMGDLLILGPGEKSHILLDLPQPIFLVRSENELIIRYGESFRLNGTVYEKQALVHFPAHFSNDMLSFALEPIYNNKAKFQSG